MKKTALLGMIAVLALFSGCANANVWNVEVGTNSTAILPNRTLTSADEWSAQTYDAGSYVEGARGRIYWTPNGGVSKVEPGGDGSWDAETAAEGEYPTVITVTGAGTEGANGDYVWISEKIWRKGSYYLGYEVSAAANYWAIVDELDAENYLYGYDAGSEDYPAASGLEYYYGEPPNPTLTYSTSDSVQWINVSRAPRSRIICADEDTVVYIADNEEAVSGKGVKLDSMRPWIEYGGYAGPVNGCTESGTAVITVKER